MAEAERQYKIRLSDGMEFGPGKMELMVQWAREGRVPKDALVVEVVSGEARHVLAVPEIARVLEVPPTSPTKAVAPMSTAPMMVPYHNGPALAGYYVAVASLICGLGLVLGPVAVILGIIGYRKYVRQPEVRGMTHAWVAMIVGGAVFVLNVAAIVLIINNKF
ncbi:MAG TPA: DUF4190 domain-containing protein [Phycisphaerales bacterium]|nr:DUF4190 domain-containing protein [Phycisphaerales bacterium]